MLTAVAAWDNLLLAYRNAARGKRGGAEVSAFEHRLEDQLIALRTELLTRTYHPGAYRSFFIHEPKRRLISAAPFRDRVVHHALCNLIEPRFERSFVADSYANRVGKGTHRALDAAQRYARRFHYVLQLDVRQYFPSIDHAILRGILARKLQDEGVLWLIGQILASGTDVLRHEYNMVYFQGDDLLAALRPRGLPIGNLTSQFWANCYLNPLDHFIKRELRCPGYVRYVDDLLLFGDDKPTLHGWRLAVEARLAGLRLTAHRAAQPRPVSEGIPFLGLVVYPDRRRLKRRKGVHFRRRLHGLLVAYEAGLVPPESVAASIEGWRNHLRYGNTVGLQRAVLDVVPPEIMALVHCPNHPQRHGQAAAQDMPGD
jgi:RNA-directed DNA polymerase